MKINKLSFLGGFLATAFAWAAPLQYKTYVASPEGFEVTSTLVYGEKDAVLIDAQFTNSDAHRLVAMILESKKNLHTIYVTHDHPDHYYGLNVVKAAFPKANIVAHADVVKGIKATWSKKLKYWKPQYGANLTDKPIVPQSLKGNSIKLENETLEISELMQGDSEANTVVWIPSLNAVIAGDLVYNNAHVWLMDAPKPEQRQAWLKSLEMLEAKNPKIVIAGHKYTGAPDNIEAVKFTKKYIQTFNGLVDSGAKPELIKSTLLTKFPQAQGLTSIVDYIAQTFGSAKAR